MTLTGHENHSISLADAAAMTKTYRNSIVSGDTISHYFGKDAILAILNQTNCVGVRIYYGLDSAGAKQIIAVGAVSDGDDLYQGLLAERTVKCPYECPGANPLNTNAS